MQSSTGMLRAIAGWRRPGRRQASDESLSSRDSELAARDPEARNTWTFSGAERDIYNVDFLNLSFVTAPCPPEELDEPQAGMYEALPQCVIHDVILLACDADMLRVLACVCSDLAVGVRRLVSAWTQELERKVNRCRSRHVRHLSHQLDKVALRAPQRLVVLQRLYSAHLALPDEWQRRAFKGRRGVFFATEKEFALHLSFESLDGPIPDRIGRLTQLDCLVLSHARLVGPIPRSLTLLTKLVELDLSSNRLQGHIPRGITCVDSARRAPLVAGACARSPTSRSTTTASKATSRAISAS